MTIKRQQGSFLLEFLISLAIFSIALVGLVKLQNRAVKDLGEVRTEMAVPILLADFTDRLNLQPKNNNVLDPASVAALKKTANALLKDVTVDGPTITIIDLDDPAIKTPYIVVLDDSRREPEPNK